MGTAQLRVAITCTHKLISASIAGAQSMHYSTSSRPLCSSFARVPKLSNRPNPSNAYGLIKRAPESQRSFILSHLATCSSSPQITSASACFASSISTISGTMETQATPQPDNTYVSYLSQADAIALDEQLMGPELGFSVDQLMELAGLSVAAAVDAEYPPHVRLEPGPSSGAGLGAAPTRPRRVLVLAGPGNNGGDGLVAARHLHHFGYSVQVCYPKPTDKPLYNGLVRQIRSLAIPLRDWSDLAASGPLSAQTDVVIDSLFGFSFKGQPRPPFDEIIKAFLPAASPPPIVSVDIPSGWHVESGDSELPPGAAMQPDMLVSLTAPKLGARFFKGAHHYLGGRFVPPAITERFRLRLPPYPGTAMCVRLGGAAASTTAAAAAADTARKVADMRISYERGGLEEAAFSGRDPMQVFDEWFKAAVAGKVCEEPNAISLASSNPSGQPSVRVVLLKGYDARGFVFYTNYSSRKGTELGNGSAAFSIYWEKLQRQIRVEGTIEQVSEAESTEYFHSRPRGSQIGAWVSAQSQPCKDRAELEARNAELQQRFSDESVPVTKPPHWGGYLIRPTSIEFWQGRPSRLHDRIRFRRAKPSESWVMDRLQP